LFADLLYNPGEARLDLDLDPNAPPLSQIRLRLSETDPFTMPWTVAEVRVYIRS
jgi:hypothetical protein